MYVLRDTTHNAALTEMTAKELRTAEAEKRPGVAYTRWTADRARRWVKDGGHHETPLYVDMDGRVRYAKDNN